MVALALLLDVVFLLTAFGIRTMVQWRRTRDTGWRLRGARRPAELAARGLLLVAGVALGAAPVAAIGSPPATGPATAVGLVTAVAAIALVLAAQLDMGDSWRVGVDPAERTEIVTGGLYRCVRNPIYTGMVAFAVGQALVLPGAWSAAAVVAMAAGVELQVRLVEERYLDAVHREVYARWAARVGRFVPGVGRA